MQKRCSIYGFAKCWRMFRRSKCLSSMVHRGWTFSHHADRWSLCASILTFRHVRDSSHSNWLRHRHFSCPKLSQLSQFGRATKLFNHFHSLQRQKDCETCPFQVKFFAIHFQGQWIFFFSFSVWIMNLRLNYKWIAGVARPYMSGYVLWKSIFAVERVSLVADTLVSTHRHTHTQTANDKFSHFFGKEAKSKICDVIRISAVQF